MRSAIAIFLCVGAVLVEIVVAWYSHTITHTAVVYVALIWFVTGLWFDGRLRRTLHGSPKGIYQDFHGKKPMQSLSKAIIGGGVVLVLASFLLLFR